MNFKQPSILFSWYLEYSQTNRFYYFIAPFQIMAGGIYPVESAVLFGQVQDAMPKFTHKTNISPQPDFPAKPQLRSFNGMAADIAKFTSGWPLHYLKPLDRVIVDDNVPCIDLRSKLPNSSHSALMALVFNSSLKGLYVTKMAMMSTPCWNVVVVKVLLSMSHKELTRFRLVLGIRGVTKSRLFSGAYVIRSCIHSVTIKYCLNKRERNLLDQSFQKRLLQSLFLWE